MDLNQTETKNTIYYTHTHESIVACGTLLKNDEIIAIPTETVYGLAGNAFSAKAVQKIFIAKERPSFDPLIVHVSSKNLYHKTSPVLALVEQNILSPEVLTWPFLNLLNQSMLHFWPGPLTYVLPRGAAIPNEVTSSQDTVGIRMPQNNVFQEILSEIDFPLAAPSANRFGRISPTTAEHVKSELDGKISAIIDNGPCTIGVESTIIQFSFHENELDSIHLLRPGKITAEELSIFFKVPVFMKNTLGQKNQSILAPGMLDQHYAPSKPLYLLKHSFQDIQQTLELLKSFTATSSFGFLCMSAPPPIELAHYSKRALILSPQNNIAEMAKNLFSYLRELDTNDEIKIILVESPPHFGIGQAIQDRLLRASIKSRT